MKFNRLMRNLRKKLLKGSNFVIYNASAGSGKTYSLTKKYLHLLLSGNSSSRFRRMLAITFTNKAVGEMKSRILDSLFKFSQPGILEEEDSMFQALCAETALSAQQMQKRCALILKQILHNYAFFEISTIDKFNHKILKTFARDLQLSQNFEVELNVDSLLEKAISNVLERTGENRDLTKALLDFSLEKIEENKSWNIAHDLMEIGKLLFQENHFSHLGSLKSKSIADLKKEQTEIGLRIKQLEKTVVAHAQAALQKVDELGFVPEDFPRKTLPNHFTKVADGEYSPKALYNNTLEHKLEAGVILKANDTRDVSALAPYLLDQYITIKKALYRRGFLRNIYANMVPLTVLNEISKEVKRLEEDEDIIPISALNQLISKEIKDQPVPFIYERLGEKYRHYFIDEFQDTSKMQWENLVPLISNALESEGEQEKRGSLFLVGDVKQAIYRWRGGSTEQFLHLLGMKDNPFVIAPHLESLDTNWRSFAEIVKFNNAFFTYVAQFLKDAPYRELFLKSCVQKPNEAQGGYVNITLIENSPSEKNERYCDKVLHMVLDLVSRGYRYSDLCILVRDNTKGGLIANFLSAHEVPIISSDSLLLMQNDTVGFLVSLLKMMDDPGDMNFSHEVLSFLARKEKIEDKHDYIAAHLNTPNTLLSDGFGFATEKLTHKSVAEILEQAIIQFKLAEGSDAYITFLMDEVLEVEKQDGPSISRFLEHWERKKATLSITAPESVDAVKIMTIHKAKGLEFPVVIFPFADSIINDRRKKKKIWVESNGLEIDSGLETLLMNFHSDMLLYPENAKKAYSIEEHKTQMDALNVLYVALTRAEKALYILTEKSKTNVSLEEAGSYSQLFHSYLHENGLYAEELEEYDFGELPKAVHTKISEDDYKIPYVTRPSLENNFSISTIQGQLWDTEAGAAIEIGNLVHDALAKIDYVNDVTQILEELELEGGFEKHQYKLLAQCIQKTVNHPLITSYFSKPYTIYKEQEILTSSGEKLRPDRIAVLDNNATILDFKTGKPSPRHKVQLLKYSEALKHMGFSIKNTIIVYIGEEVHPLFI